MTAGGSEEAELCPAAAAARSTSPGTASSPQQSRTTQLGPNGRQRKKIQVIITLNLQCKEIGFHYRGE